ncbi:Hypothetical protein NTJ_07332 [Nesidiocoris tenuis]|uniref:Uncharacterized protein n=1 Tax=Nesidiocoris tenuis TaxID=355587 RepID=A0ABN7ARG0_9HEMI|nr:Hypothetical protein NTJ_07332 [Nesidiocoris tenuis]
MLEKKSHQIPLNRQEKNSYGLSKRVCPGKIDWESMVKVLDEQKRPDLRPSRGKRRESVADLRKSSKTEFEAVPFEPTDAVFGNLEERISSAFASEFTFLDDNDEIEIGEELDDLVSAEMSKFSQSGTFSLDDSKKTPNRSGHTDLRQKMKRTLFGLGFLTIIFSLFYSIFFQAN